MPTVDVSPCPQCQATGTLALGVTLVPTGGAVAGTGFNLPVVEAPVLTCSACEMRKVGQYDRDGRHVLFPPDR
jgi:hypothetical protein